jgi:prepilin-type N-terminal cleavage/methylation domain-containing protein
MKRTRHTGFTLLEVMAAMLIMAGAVLALVQRQSQSMAYTKRIMTQTQAIAAAETAMDEFLVHPDFEAAGDVIDSEVELDVPGVTDRGYRIVRTIAEVIPLEDQETIYVDPDAEPYYELTEEEEFDEDEPEFDPGTFVTVRFEVFRSTGGEVRLVVLETWLPKPPLPEEEDDTTGGDTTPGSMTGPRTGIPTSGGGRRPVNPLAPGGDRGPGGDRPGGGR